MLSTANGFLSEYFYILGNQRRRLPFFVFLFITQAILDVAGTAMVWPLVMLLATPSKSVAAIAKYHLPIPIGNIRVLMLLFCAVIAVLFLLRGVLTYRIQRALLRFGYEQRRRVQIRLLQSYQELPYEFHLQRNSADLINTIVWNANTFADSTVTGSLRLISDSFTLLAIFVLLLNTNFVAVLILACLIAAIGAFYRYFIRHATVTAAVTVSEAGTKIIATLQNALTGLKDIRVLGTEKYFEDDANANVRRWSDALTNYNSISLVPNIVLGIMLVFFIVGISMYYTFFDAGAHDQLLPTLGVFAVAGLRIIPSAASVFGGMVALRYSRVAMHSLYVDLRAVEIAQANVAMQLAKAGPVPAKVRAALSAPFQKLELRGIAFRYALTQRDALQDINLEVRRGEAIGIVGSSGAGKSTLADILLGLLTPTAGDILVNGCSITQSPRLWLNKVAYVPQNVFIIDDTLRKNIALGIPDAEIDESKILDAMAMARLESVLNNLPLGLDTMLGERGMRLSGGQRQRVALARAFYFERDVLLLDEATSALDYNVEREIVEEIRNLKRVKTLIVIAHRLSTIEHCDTVIRIDEGRLVQQGSFSEVVKTTK